MLLPRACVVALREHAGSVIMILFLDNKAAQPCSLCLEMITFSFNSPTMLTKCPLMARLWDCVFFLLLVCRKPSYHDVKRDRDESVVQRLFVQTADDDFVVGNCLNLPSDFDKKKLGCN